MNKYFLDCDGNGHWYLIIAEKRKEWSAWRNLDEDDENSWSVPDFAKRLSGHPNQIEFYMNREK